MDPPESNPRARALIAIAAILGLGGLIALILVLGGGEDERAFAAAPAECVEAWNRSEDALSTGRHNYVSHRYTRAQLAYANEDVSEISDSPIEPGSCIIVFPAEALDPEPWAAAEVHLGERWGPASQRTDTARLAELQRQAQSAFNVVIDREGNVEPLDSAETG